MSNAATLSLLRDAELRLQPDWVEVARADPGHRVSRTDRPGYRSAEGTWPKVNRDRSR